MDVIRGCIETLRDPYVDTANPKILSEMLEIMDVQGERLQALYLNDRGDAVFFTSSMTAAGFTGLEGGRIVGLADGEDGMARICDVLLPGVLAVDTDWPARFVLDLMRRNSALTLVTGSHLVDRARMIKDAEEMEFLRESSRINDAVMAEMIKRIPEELTEGELSQAGNALFVRHGRPGPGLPPMVCYGPNCSEPHHLDFAGDRLHPGDFVTIDMGTSFHGYQSDMTRTAAYGQPTQLQRDIYQIVLEANLAGIAAARAGVPTGEVDRAARTVIEKAGYGEQFLHRTGHGVGLEGHELPEVGPNSEFIIQPGMCFSVEPGIYLPGVTGVRIEDLILITETGVEVLNHYPKQLMICEKEAT